MEKSSPVQCIVKTNRIQNIMLKETAYFLVLFVSSLYKMKSGKYFCINNFTKLRLFPWKFIALIPLLEDM